MIDPDVSELDALSALIESDGWALFLTYVEAAHGDTASTRQIDTALGSVERGDHEAARDTVQQIRTAARAVQRVTSWPTERVKQLKTQKEKPQGFLARRRA